MEFSGKAAKIKCRDDIPRRFSGHWPAAFSPFSDNGN
jgi:hypothetical protein